LRIVLGLFLSALLAFSAMVYEDVDSQYTIEQIRSKPELFHPLNPHKTMKQLNRSTFWLKATIANYPIGDKNLYLLFELPNMNSVNLYYYQDGALIVQKNGTDVLIDERRVQARQTVFEIPSVSKEPLDLFFEIRSDNVIDLRFSLHSQMSLMETLLQEEKIDMAIIGALGALFLYNFFLLFATKDSSYALYLGYLTGIVGYWIYATNALPLVIDPSLLAHLSFCLTTFFILAFLWRLLVIQPSKWTRIIAKVFVVLIVFYLLYGVFTPLGAISLAATLKIHLIAIVSIVGIIIYGMRHKNPIAKYLLLGWLFFISGSIITNLSLSEVIAGQLSQKGLFIGSIMEAIVFSLVLASRLRIQYELAIKDNLTKLYNRNKMDEVFAIEKSKADLGKAPFGIMIIDLDHFKMINDTYGHLKGDKILKELSAFLQKSIRKDETLCRWGGEEFLLVVPVGDKESILAYAERLRKGIEKSSFGGLEFVSASFGVTLYQVEEDIDKALTRADDALYKSKKSGRNQVSYL
jgi:diguanylate cyclase (GGDEF)-like protein